MTKNAKCNEYSVNAQYLKSSHTPTLLKKQTKKKKTVLTCQIKSLLNTGLIAISHLSAPVQVSGSVSHPICHMYT